MCWTPQAFDAAVDPVRAKVRDAFARPTAPPAGTPSASGDALRQLILGKFGSVGAFDARVREAGLGTSTNPKTMGSIKDPTRQS